MTQSKIEFSCQNPKKFLTIAKNYTFCKTGIREYCLIYVVRFVLEIY